MRILHLYHDLMNLYGDWANVDILARALAARGYVADVEKKSVGEEIDFARYDFVYIGSGTERSQRACMQDLARHKAALLEQIEKGQFVLATGNSHELFGNAIITASGERFETLGLLDFETAQHNTRVTGDCVCTASFLPEKLIGFINRVGGEQRESGELIEGRRNSEQSKPQPVERPFSLELGPCAGSRHEGIRYKNLLGTYLTGPLLVRNPPLLAFFVNEISKTDDGPLPCESKEAENRPLSCESKEAENRPLYSLSPLFEQQNIAHQAALSELLKRK